MGLCSALDSPFTALELSVFKPWSVRPAQVSDCTVTVCGSHVKRVIKLVIEPPAKVELGLLSASIHGVFFDTPFTTLELSALNRDW